MVPQYGVGGYRVDFAATHPQDPDRMVLAIEADGASYRESGSVRDRDRLRGEHLQRLGWNFHRLWSTNWFHDPDAEVAKVRAAYERAVADSGPPPGTGAADPAEPAHHAQQPGRAQTADHAQTPDSARPPDGAQTADGVGPPDGDGQPPAADEPAANPRAILGSRPAAGRATAVAPPPPRPYPALPSAGGNGTGQVVRTFER